MAELTQNEKRLLSMLVQERQSDALHLATILDATPESVVQWAHLLEDKGLVSLERTVDRSFVYTDEGKEYLNTGLPETQLLKLCHNETPLAELQKHASFRIGFGQLRKKGIIRVNNGMVSKIEGASTIDDETALKNPRYWRAAFKRPHQTRNPAGNGIGPKYCIDKTGRAGTGNTGS